MYNKRAGNNFGGAVDKPVDSVENFAVLAAKIRQDSFFGAEAEVAYPDV